MIAAATGSHHWQITAAHPRITARCCKRGCTVSDIIAIKAILYMLSDYTAYIDTVVPCQSFIGDSGVEPDHFGHQWLYTLQINHFCQLINHLDTELASLFCGGIKYLIITGLRDKHAFVPFDLGNIGMEVLDLYTATPVLTIELHLYIKFFRCIHMYDFNRSSLHKRAHLYHLRLSDIIDHHQVFTRITKHKSHHSRDLYAYHATAVGYYHALDIFDDIT